MAEGNGHVRVGSQISGFSSHSPSIGGAVANQTMNDTATIAPFAGLTVTDPDTQELFARVTIDSGTVRGDFTPASTVGWTRTVVGSDIRYTRYYPRAVTNGAAVQTALRAFGFQPRSNVLPVGQTETAGFKVYVTDGVSSATDASTRVVTTSVNDVPMIGGAGSNQPLNDNEAKAVFSTLTVTDPDTQDLFVRVTIDSGIVRGDFTTASTVGWTRSVNGSDFVYSRYFSRSTNVGNIAQSAIRALVFQPRTNVPIGATETTGFLVFVNDGRAY